MSVGPSGVKRLRLLDIARADRTASYAIPAEKVQAVVAEMLPK